MENVVSDEDVAGMKEACYQLVEDMDPKQHHTVFSSEKQNYRDNYFMNSSDKIGYFFEDGALDENGKLQVEKQVSLNKIGHALHVLTPAFRKVTFSEQIKNAISSLGYDDPVITQSMYIFKQPRLGGAVLPHQDATYLYTEPSLKVMGVWIALEDTTLDNGCLQFIPGSHKDGIYGDYRMVRNPESEGPRCIHIGEKHSFSEDKFVAEPIKKGSMIFIDGLVVHSSKKNTSAKSRHIYTFHIYDHKHVTWNSRNWLQPTPAGTFEHMNDVKLLTAEAPQ